MLLTSVYSDYHLKLPIGVVELSIKKIHVIPVLWSFNNQIKSTLSSSVRKTMFLLHSAMSPIDPSFSLNF